MTMTPAISTTQAETETLRITRWDLPPSSETGPHQHEYDYVVVPLTGGALTVTDPAGTVSTNPLTIGASYHRQAGVEHNVANLGDEPVAFVEVELLEHPIP